VVNKLILALFTLLLIGCGVKVHQNFSFKKLNIITDCGEILFDWRGRMVKTVDGSESSSPYELVIWMEGVDDSLISISINEVKLLKKENKSLVTNKTGLVSAFKNTKSQGRKASFLIADLNMEHVWHTLNIKYAIHGNDYICEGEELEVQVEPIIDRKEITIKDIFMGI
jgi:hypothetical protein